MTVWIHEDVVRAIHHRQIAEHGGLDGIRDETLLASALSKPQNVYAYSNPKPDIAVLAASYAYGICQNHPFNDGNKRTALVVLRLFLHLNSQDLKASATDKYQTIVKLAAGELTEDALAEWVRRHMRKN